MLMGIPKILSPELLKVLCEMGHGDSICIADGNFPSATVAKDAILLRADGHGVPELLDAILTVFPLDRYVEKPVTLMSVVPAEKDTVKTPIWDEYREIISRHDNRGESVIEHIDRFAYYEKAKKNCYCILATGESALYANIILQKGVIPD